MLIKSTLQISEFLIPNLNRMSNISQWIFLGICACVVKYKILMAIFSPFKRNTTIEIIPTPFSGIMISIFKHICLSIYRIAFWKKMLTRTTYWSMLLWDLKSFLWAFLKNHLQCLIFDSSFLKLRQNRHKKMVNYQKRCLIVSQCILKKKCLHYIPASIDKCF